MTDDLQKNKKENPGALFIPAGIIIGLGVGFLINNISAALFIGFGFGFLLFALTSLLMKK